jgi:hypothetical protein
MKRLMIIAALLLCFGTGAKAQFYGIKANALGLATGTINAGVEVAVEKQWSVELSGYWNPIKTDGFSARAWWVQPAVRYWRYEHFVGHFFAAHPAYGRYNVGNDKWYYKGWFTGLGVSYGYTWLLSKRWNLTAEAGLGLYYMSDTKRNYEYDDWSPICITHYRRVALMPSKLEVSFSYLF